MMPANKTGQSKLYGTQSSGLTIIVIVDMSHQKIRHKRQSCTVKQAAWHQQIQQFYPNWPIYMIRKEIKAKHFNAITMYVWINLISRNPLRSCCQQQSSDSDVVSPSNIPWVETLEFCSYRCPTTFALPVSACSLSKIARETLSRDVYLSHRQFKQTFRQQKIGEKSLSIAAQYR